MSKKLQYIFIAALFFILIVIAIFISTTSDPSQKRPITYIVKVGDTCNRIAYRYKVPVEAITEINRLPPGCNLLVGQELIIPAP
jgi:LysM repeat protein